MFTHNADVRLQPRLMNSRGSGAPVSDHQYVLEEFTFLIWSRTLWRLRDQQTEATLYQIISCCNAQKLSDWVKRAQSPKHSHIWDVKLKLKMSQNFILILWFKVQETRDKTTLHHHKVTAFKNWVKKANILKKIQTFLSSNFSFFKMWSLLKATTRNTSSDFVHLSNLLLTAAFVRGVRAAKHLLFIDGELLHQLAKEEDAQLGRPSFILIYRVLNLQVCRKKSRVRKTQ